MGAQQDVGWGPELATGVEEMDRQHRILIGAIQELETWRGPGAAAARFEQVTRDLLAYAIYHFETEEQLIRHYGYDRAETEEAEAHLRQHRDFSRRIVDLRARLQGDETAPQDAIVSFLRQWWKAHICTTDQLLARFILARRSHAG
jgi:hemerythrin